MLTDGFAVVSKISSRFVHELLPVALASVVGALIVNHYGGGQATTPVVVRADLPPGADDFLKALREERAALAAVLKRDAEAGPAKADPAAPSQAIALAAYDPPTPPPRPSIVKKSPPRTAGDLAKPAPDARPSAGDRKAAAAPPPAIDLKVDATLDDDLADDAGPTPGAGPIGGMRAFVVNAAQWSAQALLPPRAFGLPGVGRLF